MHPHDHFAGVRALGTRRRLVKTVPDRLGPPRDISQQAEAVGHAAYQRI